MLDIECTNNLTDVQSECNLVLGMAKLKDLIAGLAQQTMRKSQEADALRREMQSLLEARQRYDDAAAKLAPVTESAKIGLALLLDGLVASDDSEGNAYASGFRRDAQAYQTAIDVDLDEIRLDQFPLWKIIREVLRQVPEMRVYELESHLKRFGVKAERSAIESALKTHRKQFKIAPRGREKFVAWKEVEDAPATTRKRKH